MTPAQDRRRPHPASPAHRHLLRARVKANVLFFDVREAGERPRTRKLWIYDLRTNRHFTLKTKPLGRVDLNEFVTRYNPENREDRTPTWSEDTPDGRWRAYDYEELVTRDKTNLDIFWLRDESLDDAASLEDPDVIAAEIIEDLQPPPTRSSSSTPTSPATPVRRSAGPVPARRL